MNKAGYVLFIAVVFAASAMGQDTTSQRKNSLTDGAWALQFGISSNFTLTSFAGTTIALKHFCSPSRAYRLGATINASTNSGDDDSPISSDTVRRIGSSDGNSESLSLQFNVLFYPSTSSDVNVYWGIGPTGSYSHSSGSSESRIVTSSRDTVTSRASSTRNSWAVGANGVVGVEWFATKSISISAEYTGTISYNYSSSSSETEIPARTMSESTGKSFSANSGGVRFGLAAYF